MGAQVLILIAIGQDEQEALTHGYSLPAARTEEGAGLKLAEGGLGPSACPG